MMCSTSAATSDYHCHCQFVEPSKTPQESATDQEYTPLPASTDTSGNHRGTVWYVHNVQGLLILCTKWQHTRSGVGIQWSSILQLWDPTWTLVCCISCSNLLYFAWANVCMWSALAWLSACAKNIVKAGMDTWIRQTVTQPWKDIYWSSRSSASRHMV